MSATLPSLASRAWHGFLAYLNAMEGVDLELAGDFVVMAATLMAIKSRSLLPSEEVDLEDDLDPKDDEEDYEMNIWAGVLPLTTVPGEPIDDSRLKSEMPVPEHVSRYGQR